MTEFIVNPGDPDETGDEHKAREVLLELDKHYPMHPWTVAFQSRVLVVRHALINEAVRMRLGRDGFGFVLKHLDSYSASQLAHNAMIAGGQLLEKFGYPRGRYVGSLDWREVKMPSDLKPRTAAVAKWLQEGERVH